jgi:uncharacterized protein
MNAHTLSIDDARRFILGKQGLWPGRRWTGKVGTEHAMRAVAQLQLDPLVVIARSHELMLHSRVIDYQPNLWAELAYGDRKFFDWGGWLAVRPMEELPYWRVLMRRERDDDPLWRKFARDHALVIDEMRAVLRKRESVSNRDFEMSTRARVNSYRGRKDSAIALHYLWRMGEAMTHHRERFERVYALTERVAPAHLICESSDEEADHFFIKKLLAFYGLSPLRSLSSWLKRKMSAKEVKSRYEAMLVNGEIVAVHVEGWKEPCYALAEDAPRIETLIAGRVPNAWKPQDTTTHDEVTFLAPLDPVSARGRAKLVFDFDYVWEVYKPAHQRKWGYYTLPILWGDRLVARMDPRLDRQTNTLVVCGFWLEETVTGQDAMFAEALAKGVERLMKFLGAGRVDARKMRPQLLRKRIQAIAIRPQVFPSEYEA